MHRLHNPLAASRRSIKSQEEIVNKVANSGLININLEDYYSKGQRFHLDIEPWLYEGLILREKDFRQSLKGHDWSIYKESFVSVNCSADAIIPQWAYMLIGTLLQDHAAKVINHSNNLKLFYFTLLFFELIVFVRVQNKKTN